MGIKLQILNKILHITTVGIKLTTCGFYHSSSPQTTGTRVFTQVLRSLYSVKRNQDKLLAPCRPSYPYHDKSCSPSCEYVWKINDVTTSHIGPGTRRQTVPGTAWFNTYYVNWYLLVKYCD